MIMLTALFTALIAAGAFIKIPMIPVPMTLQTLFVFLAGLLLTPSSAASYLHFRRWPLCPFQPHRRLHLRLPGLRNSRFLPGKEKERILSLQHIRCSGNGSHNISHRYSMAEGEDCINLGKGLCCGHDTFHHRRRCKDGCKRSCRNHPLPRD